MNEITKLELFAAYLPYNVEATDADDDFDGRRWKQTLYNVHIAEGIAESRKLILRPLSALQTPMLHPVTGERIEDPAEWIAGKSGANDSDVIAQVKGNLVINDQTDIIRAIDRLALELHFDVFGAIEKGWAVQI